MHPPMSPWQTHSRPVSQLPHLLDVTIPSPQIPQVVVLSVSSARDADLPPDNLHQLLRYLWPPDCPRIIGSIKLSGLGLLHTSRIII
jgi:hypothetical protein